MRWKGFWRDGRGFGECLAARREKMAKRESAQVLSLAFPQIQRDPGIKRDDHCDRFMCGHDVREGSISWEQV